jgi:hypothetical protein
MMDNMVTLKAGNVHHPRYEGQFGYSKSWKCPSSAL